MIKSDTDGKEIVPKWLCRKVIWTT